MKYSYFLLFVVFSIYTAIAQVGIGTTNPDASAVLDVESDSQGMLTPRMSTANRNMIATPATGLLVFDTDLAAFYFYNGTSWVEIGIANTNNDYTGWADYSDSTYTSISPFRLTANNKVTLPNNATKILDFQKPIDIVTFYDGTNNTITGRNGDGLNIVIEFKVRPTANQTTKITVAIDIGGGVGEIYKRDFITSKGVGVQHFYLSSFTGYTLGTWEANGGTVKIVSDFAADVYDVRYVLTRTHKAR